YLDELGKHKGGEFDNFWLILAKSMCGDYERYRPWIWDAFSNIGSAGLLIQTLSSLPIQYSTNEWNYAFEQLQKLDCTTTSFAEIFFVLTKLLPGDQEIDIWAEFNATFKNLDDIAFNLVGTENLSNFCRLLTTEQVLGLI